MLPLPRSIPALVLFPATLALAACDEDVVGEEDEVPVNLAIAVDTDAQGVEPGPAGIEISGTDERALVVHNVTLLVSEIELEADTDGDVDCDDRPDQCEDFVAGPLFITLPLSGEVATVIETEVPPRIYEELEIEIAEIRVIGTFDDQPFDVAFDVEEDFEVDFDPPLVVEEDGEINVTLLVDLTLLFREDGVLIDPDRLRDPARRSEIVAALRLAFEAFRDEDLDGEED